MNNSKGVILGKNGKPIVDSARAKREIQSRFNAIENFGPAEMTAYVRAYKSGHVNQLLRVAEDAFEADDTISSVFPKRCRAVSQLDYTIIKTEESEEADKHAKALEFFFDNLTATHALKQDLRGGFKTLVKQMMTAVGYEYAYHEIAWEPVQDSEGKWQLTAEFKQVPASFFETTTGKSRFLVNQYDIYGEDLDERRWLVTCAQHSLLRATMVAYVFKQLPLKDWLIHCEKFGFPWVHAKTDAQRGSDDWDDFLSDVAGLGNDCQLVTNQASEIEMKWPGSLGDAPQQALVDRMDRAIATLWRGGDLSTMSKGDAVGATQQQEERENIEADDAEMISEVLNVSVCRPALNWLFGCDRGLAYIQIKPTERVDTEQERKTDEFLMAHGVKLSVQDLAERYGRTLAEDGEAVASGKEEENVGKLGSEEVGKLGSEEVGKLENETTNELTNSTTNELTNFSNYLQARKKAFAPLLQEMDKLADLEPEQRGVKIQQLLENMPTMADKMVGTKTADALESVLAEKMVKGAMGDELENEACALGFWDGLKEFFNSPRRGYHDKRDKLGRFASKGTLSTKQNIKAGNDAVKKAVQRKGDVRNAMNVEGIGKIDFLWGRGGHKKPRPGGGTHTDGYGLSHIQAKHGNRALAKLPTVLAKGEVSPHKAKWKRNVIYGRYHAVIGKPSGATAYAITNFDEFKDK